MKISLTALGSAAAISALACISLPAHADAAGKSVYQNLCSACHGMGITSAPVLGDKEAWAPRVAKGREQLYHSALYGFTGPAGPVGCGRWSMMPKGGFMHLTDEQVTGAVDYMLEAVGAGEESEGWSWGRVWNILTPWS